MLRITVVAVYALLLAWLTLTVAQAAPAPSSQPILGVGIGQYDGGRGVAHISGRRLACTPTNAPTEATRCTLDLVGGRLTIHAQRNPPGHPDQLGGTCSATHRGRTWPCRMASRHVHVHWFAYLDEPLGLSPAELNGLRRAYFWENLSETTIVRGVFALALFSALIGAALFGVWLAARRVSRALTLVGSGAIGVLVGVLFFGQGLFWMIGMGFID